MTAIQRALAALGSLVAAIAATWILGRRAGSTAATTKAKDADHARADDVRARADAARAAAADDPIAELRRSGRIRD